MTPELISALRERIKQGQAKEVTKAEVLKMGHTEAVFESAYAEALNEVPSTPDQVNAEVLPRTWQLITEGIVFAKKNLILTALLAVPMLIALISAQVGMWFPNNQAIVVTSSLITAFSFLVYFFSLAAVFYLVVKTETGTVTTTQPGFVWAKKRFFSFVFITLLSTLMILAGFALFIIPGIILSISLFFAAYALVHEDVRGMRALTRSHALVKGRWWKVAKKVAGISLIGVSVFFLLGILVGIIDGLFPVTIEDSVLFDVLFEPLAAFVTIVMMYASNQLFLQLQRMTPAVPASKKKMLGYWALALFGVVLIVLFIRFAISVMNDPEMLNTAMTVESKLLQEEIKDLSGPALTFANTQERSFLGVCATLTPLITMSSGDIVCNDTKEAWALAASTRGERWCADSSGFAKKIVTTLDDKTACMARP